MSVQNYGTATSYKDVELTVVKSNGADVTTPLVGQQPKQSYCSWKVKAAVAAVFAVGLVVGAVAFFAKDPCGSGEKFVEDLSKGSECFCALANSTLAACSKTFNGRL
jgi:hypothetical protein